MARRDRTLHLDTDDRKIAGVCSGLARYFDVDPILVRVAFVATLVFGGGSIVAYALLWWLVDPVPADTSDDEASASPGETGNPTGAPLAPPDADGRAA